MMREHRHISVYTEIRRDETRRLEDSAAGAATPKRRARARDDDDPRRSDSHLSESSTAELARELAALIGGARPGRDDGGWFSEDAGADAPSDERAPAAETARGDGDDDDGDGDDSDGDGGWFSRRDEPADGPAAETTPSPTPPSPPPPSPAPAPSTPSQSPRRSVFGRMMDRVRFRRSRSRGDDGDSR
mmetsp:Transcript_20153/g.60184  ORF Transcript_20153/g.60184 Transcript_20153/m.60184 type:complete len:188 (+) Transcript_20153:390-953(+)